MDYSAYFTLLNIHFPVREKLYQALNYAIENNSFYESPSKQMRHDVSKELRKEIQDILPFAISDCGFFKNEPGWDYPVHIDTRRFFAINMLMVDDHNDFENVFYLDDPSLADYVDGTNKEKFRIPYVKDQLVLINTKKYHSVKNKSADKTRYVLSIGNVDTSYDIIKNNFI
jgi:hypothetical protein